MATVEAAVTGEGAAVTGEGAERDPAAAAATGEEAGRAEAMVAAAAAAASSADFWAVVGEGCDSLRRVSWPRRS